MDEYSLARAFKRIEQELIFSMIRNFEKHKAEELDEGFNWDQWQVVQLRELEKYRRKNLEKFDEDFSEINDQIAELFRMALEDGQTEEEAKILEQILRGVFLGSDNEYGEMPISFFGTNDRKLESLIQATTDDMEKAEYAILRRANDLYRRTIYDAQIYAANGGTYEQAIDMATKDFCKKGITSIVYKNGSRHNISEYAEMAIRTGNKRAYLMGEGNMHAKYGVHTIYVKKRPQACPLCLRWTGRVLIDDVYGGGTAEESKRKGIPLLSTAMDLGFLHPNCKDVYSLFIPGVDDETDPWTEEEIRDLADDYNKALKKKRYEREAEEYEMLAKTRLDPDNRREAEAKAKMWSDKATKLKLEPREEWSHRFTSGIDRQWYKRDALVYEYEGFRFYVPKDFDPEKQTLTPYDLIAALDKVPEEIKHFVPKNIELVDYENARDPEWRKLYKDFTSSSATYNSSNDTITFYARSHYGNIESITENFMHETGHRIDYLISLSEQFSAFSETEIWKRAMKLDEEKTGYVSPTEYGENSPGEDFAESVLLYAELLAKFGYRFPHRATLISKILKELIDRGF